ncbi:hypothetical protein [Absidia glauca]|uniref:Uncharacterized protein n=1 Tax=Absidia glauca TaxID=4829 RepID=A0A168SGE0_ABSGL|nr:hypothetical protein [Absidia glauca]
MDINAEEFLIPGLELISLTGDDDLDDRTYVNQEPMIDWLEDCEVQENLFQIIPLTPEETCCDQDNHIIQPQQVSLFFEELGILYDEPEPIDPSRDYEAEYQLHTKQLEELYSLKKRARRQHHMHLDSIPKVTSNPPDITTSPGLSSSSSSFHHTDDDHYEDEDHRSPHYLGRLSHRHHPHKHIHHPSISKPSHFTFSSDRF